MRGRTAYGIHGRACGRAGVWAGGGVGVALLEGSLWRLRFVVFCFRGLPLGLLGAASGGGDFGGRGAHGSLDLVEI